MAQTDSSVDAEVVQHFFCAVFGQNKTTDVNKARIDIHFQEKLNIGYAPSITSTLYQRFEWDCCHLVWIFVARGIFLATNDLV